MVKACAALCVVGLVGAAATATAHPQPYYDRTNPPPILIAKDPPPPPPPPPKAEPPREPAKPAPPARNMLGFRMGVGQLTIAHQPMSTTSVAVVTERRLLASLRGFADYEWLSLSDITTGVPTAQRLEGYGHRGGLGLRHVLADTTLKQVVRFYVDGEIGGGLAWTTDNRTGVHVQPHGLVGLRFGYTMITPDEKSPSKEFECDFLLRTIINQDGAGLMFGVGMTWGG